MRDWYMAAYVADVWKLHPRLTFSYGLRWEPDIPENLTLGQVASYIEDNRVARIQSTSFQRAPLGFTFPGDPGFPGIKGRYTNWWTFAPRAGFGWDVNGDGRTSVRASGGIAYEYPNAQFHLWTSISQPWGGQVNLGSGGSFDDPYANFPGGNPFPAQYGPQTPFVASGGWTTLKYDMKPAQIQSWNLSIQRQLSTDFLVSASYIGSHTIHMLGAEPLNPATYIPGNGDANGNCFLNGQAVFFTVRPGTPCSTTARNNGSHNTFLNVNLRRRLSLSDFDRTGQFVGALANVTSDGNAGYNGLLLSVRKRATQGVTVDANYTWSHCIAPEQDDANGGTGLSSTSTYTIPGDRDRTRGNCGSDRRHALNLTGVVATPTFANNAVRMIASNWRVSTIYRRASGEPLTVSSSVSDLARNGTVTGGQPAVYNGADPYLDRSGRPRTVWFNAAAFSNPAVGTFGNLGKSNLRGPSSWAFDMALSRTFQLNESRRVEVRAEAYNVTNSFRPGNPSTNRGSSQFGQILNAESPRILQFAAKFVF
jgi:hypothetical protein